MARRSSTPNLSVYQGDDRQWQLTMQRNTLPFDLTNYTVVAHIRETIADDDNGGPPIAEFTVVVSDPTSGEVLLVLPRSESVKLKETVYNWDVQIVDGSNSDWTTTVVRGTLNVTHEVTRA